MLRNRFVLLLLSGFLATTVSAQLKSSGNTAWKKYRHEGGLHYGYNTLFARLGENDKLGFNYMMQRSTFTLNYRYYLLKTITVRGSFSHAYARKNDKAVTNEAQVMEGRENNARIDYKTTLSELALLAEYHLWDETQMGKKKKVRRARGGMSKSSNIGVSVFSGVAFNYLRPNAELYGSRVILRPVNSDPGFDLNVAKYKRMNVHVPVGLNVRKILNENFRFGVELGYRIGFRQYMDNVSAIYYRDGRPSHLVSEFPDSDFTGYYVTYSKEESVPAKSLVLDKGRKGYFFGMLTLSYRLKS